VGKILASNREEKFGRWNKLHNENFRDLYFPPNVSRIIKLRRIQRVDHLARIRKIKNACRVLVGKVETVYFEDSGVDGR
jgi:hypothetical protein